MSFALYGAASSLFCFVWMLLAASSPTASRFVAAGELEMLRKEGVVEPAVSTQASATETKAKGGFSRRMLFSAPVMAVCYAHSVFNFGRYFLYGWMPTFYVDVLHVDAMTAGFYMTCLQVADACMKLLVAPFADALVSSGKLSILGLRRLLSCTAFVGFGVGMGLCALTKDPMMTTAALVISKSAASCHAAGFKSNYLDISKRYTGTIAGVGNTLATLSSTVAPLVAGTVIQASGWNAMFLMCLLVNLSGAAVFGIFSSATNLDDLSEASKEGVAKKKD